jgi:hypothetical protein
MYTFVSIDPGKNGAITKFVKNSDKDFPLEPLKTFSIEACVPFNGMSEFDIYEAVKSMASKVDLSVIEKSEAFPGQSCVATFTTGYIYGITCLAASSSKSMIEIRPVEWINFFRNRHNISKLVKKKERSETIFRLENVPIKRKLTLDQIESVLIGLFFLFDWYKREKMGNPRQSSLGRIKGKNLRVISRETIGKIPIIPL